MPTVAKYLYEAFQHVGENGLAGKVSADSLRTLRTHRTPRLFRPALRWWRDDGIQVRPFAVLVHPSVVDTPSTFRQHVDPELIERFKRGDLAAFESIYRRFERAAWTLALRLTGRRDVAQEALQDSMLKAFERARQFRGEAPFGAWLRKLVVNEALMQLRHDRLHIIEVLDDDARSGDDAPPPWRLADAAALDRALNRLPDTARAVLWLYHVEGFTHIEIAEQFGRSTSFSKSQLARATRRLRELLIPQVEDTPCTIGSTTTA
ncbi:MAG: hypothetical protein OJF55_000019 [Rhodanobacteraceae bacterium]|nr:MAG: hypothetical protein OJF55_000019 [Rhodanobacteraceae bacterium]